MKKGKLFVSTSIFLLLASTTVLAVPQVFQNISAQLRPDIKIYVDGEPQVLKDASGNEVCPIIYEGTTYLPVRAIGEITNNYVYWDENQKNIDLILKDSNTKDELINLETANLETLELEKFFNSIEYPNPFSFDKFEYKDNILKVYLHQTEEIKWSRVLETVALSIYDKFSGIKSIEFETSKQSENITKTYTYKWYLYQMGYVDHK